MLGALRGRCVDREVKRSSVGIGTSVADPNPPGARGGQCPGWTEHWSGHSEVAWWMAWFVFDSFLVTMSNAHQH